MTTSSSAPLRVGILGCGMLGVIHTERLSKIPDVRVVAVSDPDEKAMQRTIAALPPGSSYVPAYADYRDMLDKSDLDFVCISSPNPWHVEQLLASLERGLHVFCEKPLSMIPDEVRQVTEATKKSGRVVSIAYQSRYRADSRILRRALQSGKWGKVTSICVYACEDWIAPNVGTWRHDPARCPGGYFADANGHQLDLIFWMSGLEAEWVRATTEKRGTPVPIVTWGEARLTKTSPDGGPPVASPSSPGVPFSFMFMGDSKLWREEISIQTEGADFVMRDTCLLWSDGKSPLAPLPESEIVPEDKTLAETPDAAFIAALRTGPDVVSPPHTVWPVLRFTLAALASTENGGAPRQTDVGGR